MASNAALAIMSAAGTPGPTGPTGATGGTADFTSAVVNGEGATSLVAGMVVCGNVAVADSVVRAKADSMTTSRVFGIWVSASTPAGGTGNAAHTGLITLTTAQWDAVVTGQVGGLTPWTVYYLSAATAGFLTVMAPGAGNVVAIIGTAISTTELRFLLQTPVQL